MRKYLLSVIIILSSLSANAQSESDSLVSLAKVSFLNITEFAGWSQFDDTQPEGKIEVVDDGLAITNNKLNSQSWQPQVMIVPDGSFDLEEGHNYVVRLTIKVPSDGQYMVNIGTWSNNFQLYSLLLLLMLLKFTTFCFILYKYFVAYLWVNISHYL